jgi:hypothetical protein
MVSLRGGAMERFSWIFALHLKAFLPELLDSDLMEDEAVSVPIGTYVRIYPLIAERRFEHLKPR